MPRSAQRLLPAQVHLPSGSVARLSDAAARAQAETVFGAPGRPRRRRALLRRQVRARRAGPRGPVGPGRRARRAAGSARPPARRRPCPARAPRVCRHRPRGARRVHLRELRRPVRGRPVGPAGDRAVHRWRARRPRARLPVRLRRVAPDPGAARGSRRLPRRAVRGAHRRGGDAAAPPVRRRRLASRRRWSWPWGSRRSAASAAPR